MSGSDERPSAAPIRFAQVKPALVAFLAALLAVVAQPAVAAPPKVAARAYLVVDGTTGDVLLGHRDRARVSIASITKLMTALVVLERTKPTDVVTVRPYTTGAGESTIRLRVGERLTVRDLLEAILIQSANDAAHALAAHVGGGSERRFVALMNRRARELGLADTSFVRPDGIDAPGHYSSARDVTELARVAMRNRVIRAIVAKEASTIAGGRSLHNWNDLLGDFPGLVGVKTGHTFNAGWCEVAAVRRPGIRIFATILGSRTRAGRNADLEELLRFGISRFRATDVVPTWRRYGEAEVGWGRASVALVPATPLRRVVRVDRPLVERVVTPGVAELPVRRGQQLGWVEVRSGGRLLGRRPLVAARTVAQPGLTGRVAWYARETAANLWDLVA